MVDISAIAGTVSALKGAVDITQAMIGLRDAKAVEAKAVELNRKILEAQSSAFAANDERAALIERIGNLEKELVALKAWGADKQRYELIDLRRGLFAYVLKIGEEQGEPQHALCANCYQHGTKSILQTSGHAIVHDRSWDCQSCKTKIKNQWNDMGALIKKSREPAA